jgi:hypothetical protein
MSNLPESATYDAGVYQIETTDPVIGGADGKDNASARNLANRTAYLKAHVDLMETIVSQADAEAGISEILKGWNALRVHQAIMAATNGYLSKSVAGSADVTLSAAEAKNGIINLTGVLTGSINLIVPATPTRSWIFKNATTGAYTLTIKMAAGTGVVCTQGYKAVAWTDGTNVMDALTDFDSPVLTGNPTAPTAAQFDNDTSLATTGFVHRAIGSASDISVYAVNTTLPITDIGKWIFPNAASVTLTLPLASACPQGSMISFSGNNVTGCTINRQDTDVIIINTNASVTSLSLDKWDTAMLINLGGVSWYLLGGEKRLGYSSAFENSLITAGYQKFPSGLILQWGANNSSGSADVAVTFPIAFPSSAINVMCSPYGLTTSGALAGGNTLTTSGFNLNGWSNNTTRSAFPVIWRAIGK